ncbi:hypothetical protein Hanom_Chr00s000496g01646641 [Helianthus anomalus]
MPRRLFCVHATVGTSYNAKTGWIFAPQVDWMLTLETDPTGSRVSAFECGLNTSLTTSPGRPA